jgi:hypothetical protein
MDSRNNVIVAGILLFLIIFNFFLPEAANVIISPSNINVIQGQNFDLNVSIDPLGIPIAGIQMDILYNSSLVKINTIREGNLFTQNGAISYFNSGIVNNSAGAAVNIYSFIIGKNSISTPGTFIVFNMTAKGMAGTSKINLSNVIISDPNGKQVPLIVYNASVTIKPPTTNITFILTDIFTGKLIQGGAVSMNGIVVISNIYGEAIFKSVIPGSHNYSINAKNYILSIGTVAITSDLRQNIKLTPKSKRNR